MKTSFLAFAAGVIVTLAYSAITNPAPKYTTTDAGWTLEHIAVPSCPDDHTRVVDLPERDEVDAMTVSCLKH